MLLGSVNVFITLTIACLGIAFISFWKFILLRDKILGVDDFLPEIERKFKGGDKDGRAERNI